MLETRENAALASMGKSHAFVFGVGRFRHNLDGKETVTSTLASSVHGPITATPEGSDKVVSHLVDYI
jgi:hypothetical protein